VLVDWLMDEIGLEQSKAEPCVFFQMTENKVSLMIRVHVDDIIGAGDKDICEKFFVKIKERFP